MQTTPLRVVALPRGAPNHEMDKSENEAVKADREKLLYSLERDVQLPARGEEDPYSNPPLKWEAFLSQKR
jgi:hypothetical protein